MQTRGPLHVVVGDLLVLAEGTSCRPGTLANPLLPVVVAVALLLQFAGLYVPFLRDLLGTQPLTLLDLAVVCPLSTLGYAAVRLDRVLFPSRRAAAPPTAGQN